MVRSAILLTVLIAGCANPPAISTNPLASLPGGDTLQRGLIDASYNLRSAITIGVLHADDPAASCVDQVLTGMGIDPASGQPAGQSGGAFTPRAHDLISAGSVAYILAQQAAGAVNGTLAVPVGCEALLGKLVLDAASGAQRRIVKRLGMEELIRHHSPLASRIAASSPTGSADADGPSSASAGVRT